MPSAHMKQPCENCPYRIDAPRRLWHRSEFEQLLNTEADPIGRTYACHKQKDLPRDRRGLCAGWLLDQKKRGLPSIALRLLLSLDDTAVAALKRVNARGLKLFASVETMCRANGVLPPPKVCPPHYHEHNGAPCQRIMSGRSKRCEPLETPNASKRSRPSRSRRPGRSASTIT